MSKVIDPTAYELIRYCKTQIRIADKWCKQFYDDMGEGSPKAHDGAMTKSAIHEGRSQAYADIIEWLAERKIKLPK